MNWVDYQGIIKEDDTFQCFACRKWFAYKDDCGLDIAYIAGRGRFFICSEDFKQGTFVASTNQSKLYKGKMIS